MPQPYNKQLELMAQRGLEALRMGDLESARRDLTAVLQTGLAPVTVAVMLAMACQRLNDAQARSAHRATHRLPQLSSDRSPVAADAAGLQFSCRQRNTLLSARQSLGVQRHH